MDRIEGYIDTDVVEDIDCRNLLNSKLLSFNIKIPRAISNSFRAKEVKLVSMIVSNLLSCIRKKQCLTYSRHVSNKTFTRTDGTPVTTKEVVKAVDWLVENGYACNFIGKASKEVAQRIPSILVPTKKLLDKFTNESLIKETETSYLATLPVMLLRSKKEKGTMKELPIRMTKEMKLVETNIRLYNAMLDTVDVCDSEGNNLTNVYKRVWSWGNMNMSGRWYGTVVNMPRVDRLGLTIDGEPVVEIDYVAIHPRILWSMYDKPLLAFPHDIYSEITESKSPTDRKMAKLALLIYLNASTEKDAKLAITGEFNALSPEEKKEYTLGKPSLLWHLINDYFLSEGMPIKEDYQGDNNIGLKLQNQDSELAAIVIERLRMVGVPVLVVHDSFIVQERYQYITEQVMSQCFKVMFDDGAMYAKVPLTIEYKREGIVHKDRKSI